MKKFNIKFDAKRFTFFALICVALVWIVLEKPWLTDIGEIKEFNRDFKNYNVIFEVFEDNGKKVASFKTAVADNDEKKMYGLMNLSQLPQDHAMLFSFFRSQLAMMWMKNTLIPLDMIFIDSDDEIATIKSNTTPKSLELISSEREVDKVLEINGGLAEKLGIKVGQKVRILKQK